MNLGFTCFRTWPISSVETVPSPSLSSAKKATHSEETSEHIGDHPSVPSQEGVDLCCAADRMEGSVKLRGKNELIEAPVVTIHDLTKSATKRKPPAWNLWSLP